MESLKEYKTKPENKPNKSSQKAVQKEMNPKIQWTRDNKLKNNVEPSFFPPPKGESIRVHSALIANILKTYVLNRRVPRTT